MATSTRRRVGTSSRRTTTMQSNSEWIKTARNHGLKIGLCLINSTGGVVTSTPFNWAMIEDTGLNTRVLEKYIQNEYAEGQPGTSPARQTA